MIRRVSNIILVFFFISSLVFSFEMVTVDEYFMQFKKPSDKWRQSSIGEFPFRTKNSFLGWMRDTEFGKSAIYVVTSRTEKEYPLDTVIEANIMAEEERNSKIEKRAIFETEGREFFLLTFSNENGIGYYPGYPGYIGKEKRISTRCTRATTVNGSDIVEFNFCSPSQVYYYLERDFKELLQTISFTPRNELKIEQGKISSSYPRSDNKQSGTGLESRVFEMERKIKEIEEKLNKIKETIEGKKEVSR